MSSLSILKQYLKESTFFSDDDFTYRLQDWENGDTGILYITGLSGSGKTTLGDEYRKKYNCQLFRTDTIIMEVIKKYEKKYNKKFHELNNITSKIMHDEIVSKISKIVVKIKEKTIVEGVHVMYLDYDILKKESLIIKGTSYWTSYFRGMNRDLVRHFSRDGLSKTLEHYYAILFANYDINEKSKDLKKYLEKQ